MIDQRVMLAPVVAAWIGMDDDIGQSRYFVKKSVVCLFGDVVRLGKG